MRLPAHSSLLEETQHVVDLLSNEKNSILERWVTTIREEFEGTATTTDEEILDHFSLILEFIIEQLQSFLNEREKYEPLNFEFINKNPTDKSAKGSKIHGKQRASINAYNVDKVYREYIVLREILFDRIEQKNLMNITVLHIITSVIEHCTRESLNTFTKTVQSIQRKLLASLVHDIRGPLNIVSLTSDLIAMGVDLKQYPEHKEKQKRALDRMSVMLEEMLQTVSIEGGQGLELKLEQADLVEHIKNLSKDTKAIYGKRFVFHCSAESYHAVIDTQAIIRVIENIVSNAFKFGSDTSDVTLNLEVQTKEIIIQVHNFGNPLSKEYQKSIFKFLKSNEGREKSKHKSWGIGLALSKATVNGHGGTIEVSSNANDGTLFTIALPRDRFSPGQTVMVKVIDSAD